MTRYSEPFLVLAALLAGVVLLSAFPGDAGAQPLSSGYVLAHDLPAGMPATGTTRVVTGDFTGDLRADTCMLAGGSAYMAFGPAIYPAIQKIPASILPATVLDFDFLPRTNGPGVFVFLTTNGIEVVTYANDDYLHEETVSTGGWSTAIALRVIDYGGSADPDIVGVASDGKTVLRIKDFDGARVYDTSLAPVATSILELDRIDWTDDGDDEIAVRLATSVEILDTTGSVHTYTPTYAPVQMQTVSFRTAADRLAVVTDTSVAGQQDLNLIGHGVSTTSTFLGTIDVTAMASADATGDGEGDLILVDRDDYVMPYLVNRYGTVPSQPFLASDPNAAFLITASAATATDNRAEPVLADLDRDGDADLVVVLGDDNLLVVQRNNYKQEDDQWAQLGSGANDTLLNPSPSYNHTLEVLLVEPRTDEIGFNAIELRLWRSPFLGSTAAVLKSHSVMPYTAGFVSDVLMFTIREPQPPFNAIYYIELRPVVETAGTITNAGPTSVFFYSSRVDKFDQLINNAQSAGMPNENGQWLPPIEDQSYSGGTGPTPGGPGGPGSGSGGPGSGGSGGS